MTKCCRGLKSDGPASFGSMEYRLINRNRGPPTVVRANRRFFALGPIPFSMEVLSKDQNE